MATLPTWAERRHAATVAAREAARDLQQHWPAGDAAEAELVARYVAADHGIAPSDVSVRVLARRREPRRPDPGRGARADAGDRGARVSPESAAWTYTTVASVRVDDYRSR